MTFKKELLLEILYGDEPGRVLDEITATSRWAVHHRMIFERDGKFWATWYAVGATEAQDETPWMHEAGPDCVEVHPVQKTVTVYEPVNS